MNTKHLMNHGLLIFSSLFISSASFAVDLKNLLKDLSYGNSQEAIQKTLGEPSSKDSESWVYETQNGSDKPRIEVGWKSGKIEYALIQPNAPVDATSLISKETKGLKDKNESTQNQRLGKRTFLIPDQGLRLTFSPGNQVIEVMITNPWLEKTKDQTLSAFLKTKRTKPFIQKEGVRK